MDSWEKVTTGDTIRIMHPDAGHLTGVVVNYKVKAMAFRALGLYDVPLTTLRRGGWIVDSIQRKVT